MPDTISDAICDAISDTISDAISDTKAKPIHSADAHLCRLNAGSRTTDAQLMRRHEAA
jgi:hypothetical protein